MCCSLVLPYSMEQSPSREANRFAASQEIPRFLCKPKVHSRSHKCSLTVSKHDTFLRWGVSAPRPTPKLEDRPLSAVHDSLFNIFATTSILDAVPPSATWRHSMLWWQGPAYHWFSDTLLPTSHLIFMFYFPLGIRSAFKIWLNCD